MASNGESNSGRYVVVARRYRPRGFDQLVGQDHVAKALANAIETGRVGHAYLFTGARGVGKTSTARIFAKALNAPEGPTVHPDEASDICQAIDAGEDIDVLEIDGASNRGIDEIRQLRAGVGVRPSRARYKIYIIDEVHMLTTAAFNALLKTLEEPPEHVKFIFCTTDPEKIPITVLSRCQRFDFAPVRLEEIAGRLREIVTAEGVEAEDEALRLLARRAAGSMRDSQSLLEQVLSFSSGALTVEVVHSMLGTADDARLSALGEALCQRDSRLSLERVDEALSGGVDAGQLGEQLLGFFRDMMTATVGCDAEMLRYCGPSLHESLREQGSAAGLQTILAIVSLLDQTLVRIRQSVHGQILLEAAIVQICALPDMQAVATLAEALRGEPSGGRSGVGRPGGTSGPGGAAGGEKKNTSAIAGGAAISGPAVGDAVTPSRPGEAGPAAGGSQQRVENAGQTVSERGAAGTSASPSADRAVGSGVLERPETAARQGTPPGGTTDNSSCPPASPAGKLHQTETQAGRVGGGASPESPGSESPGSEPTKPDPTKPESAGPKPAVPAPKQTRPAAKPSGPRPSATANRRQRLRDAEQHPLVRQVIEMFEAEIIRVDEPRE